MIEQPPLAAEIDRLRAELAAAKAELHSWRGCPSCHEDHGPESICPPYEVRTTGSSSPHWQRNLWEGRTRAARAELAAAQRELSDAKYYRDLLRGMIHKSVEICTQEACQHCQMLGKMLGIHDGIQVLMLDDSLKQQIEHLHAKLAVAEAERDKLAAENAELLEANDFIKGETAEWREALVWYGDPANYLEKGELAVPGHWGEWQDAEPDGHRRKWVQDHGQRARQALGRETECQP